MAGLSQEGRKRLSEWQARVVRDGLVPWSHLQICKSGEVVFSECHGAREDNIHRWYSSTKPITCVALMMLYEEGRFQLKDPVFKYFGDAWKKKNMRVFVSGRGKDMVTEECRHNITVQMLLSHTSGLTYGFDTYGIGNPVDGIYNHLRLNIHAGKTLPEWVAGFTKAPLVFQPGTAWHYGYNTDCVGYLVEVISGMPFGDFLQSRILRPLQMVDAGFIVPPDKKDRFVECYAYDEKTKKLNLATKWTDGKGEYTGGVCQSGGGGLVGTSADYMRFARMLANGGVLDGVRILSTKTLEMMTSNVLPDNVDIANFKPDSLKGAYMEIEGPGVGFGLGFSVMLDPVKNSTNGSAGSFGWGGAASTHFFIDPKEDLAIVFATQLMGRNEQVFPRNGMIAAVAYGAVERDAGVDRRPPFAKL